jgi:hypothetical protein
MSSHYYTISTTNKNTPNIVSAMVRAACHFPPRKSEKQLS